MSGIRKRFTYANITSTICLILVVGGGSAFAASQFGKETIGSRALKKEAVTPAKLSQAAKATLTGAVGAKGATGDTGAAGAAGPQGAPGTARAFGETVDNNGTLSAARSKNATVRHAATGIYCITPGGGVDPATATLIVSADFDASGTTKTIAQIRSNNFDCKSGELEVRIWDDGTVKDAEFSFLIP